VQVSVKQKQAVVLVAKEQYDPSALLTALKRAGFRGTLLEGGAAGI
jgi:riboflavin biosynthesis pyrimidine reductase